jgi:hypothetical protein
MLEELKNKTFANEAEEAAWWESHEDALLEQFEKATAEGRAGIGTVAKRAGLPSNPPSANSVPQRPVTFP